MLSQFVSICIHELLLFVEKIKLLFLQFIMIFPGLKCSTSKWDIYFYVYSTYRARTKFDAMFSFKKVCQDLKENKICLILYSSKFCNLHDLELCSNDWMWYSQKFNYLWELVQPLLKKIWIFDYITGIHCCKCRPPVPECSKSQKQYTFEYWQEN